MLLNYLRLFLRNFSGNRIYSAIIVLGLASGLACFVLIRLYVVNEHSYDRHHPHSGRMYRLGMKGDMSGFSFESAVMGGPIGNIVKEEIPEVLRSTTFYKYPRSMLFTRDQYQFYEERIVFADSSFLSFFNFEVLHGNDSAMLSAPYSLVLTKHGAKKYFGEQNPVGQVLRVNNKEEYTVTGVIEDPIQNSHLKFDLLASYNSLLEQEVYRNLLTTFYAFVTYNYILLDKGENRGAVEDKIRDIIDKNMGEGMRESGSHFEVFLQPIEEIHLNSDLVHELEANGSSSTTSILGIVSILILFIACVNFINLTTARSASRFKEIGLRKTIGADRRNLFIQFISESICYALAGIILAGIFIELILPWFYDYTSINRQTSIQSKTGFYMSLLILAVLVGVVSGLYPAAYMSRIKPAWIMKGFRSSMSKRPAFRSFLVIAQLSISMFLIFSTLVIYQQLQFIQKTNIGASMEDLLIVPLRESSMFNHYAATKGELKTISGVVDVTASSAYLGNFQQRRGFFVEGYDRNDMWMLHHVSVDQNYLDMMEIKLLKGRTFRPGGGADSNSVIINLSMMNQAGWEDPIGKKILMQERGVEKEFYVIGLVDDFNYASIHSSVESLLIFYSVSNCRQLGIRINNKYRDQTLESIGNKWDQLYPEYPFDYFYQEDFYNDLYKEEQSMSQLFIYFTLLAIIISVMGLFGLVLFTSIRRTKEIGIRKAMGGSTRNILFLLINKYQLWIMLSSVVALPSAWYFTQKWLQNFTIKIQVNAWIYIGSFMLVWLISLGTIVYQTHRAARSNPVNVLRYE